MQVDLVLFGHVHSYERTCSIFNSICKGMPLKDINGIDTYDHNNYTAPLHAVIGMAGFTLDQFPLLVLPFFLSILPHSLFIYNYIRI